MDAGDGVKRIGRADQPQQLAGRAGSLRELLLSRRSFSAFSCRYGLAEPQPQRHNEWTRTSKCAWRVVLSMHISNGSSPQPVARPVALPNPRRSGVRKTGAPSSQKGVRCGPPTKRNTHVDQWSPCVFRRAGHEKQRGDLWLCQTHDARTAEKPVRHHDFPTVTLYPVHWFQ